MTGHLGTAAVLVAFPAAAAVLGAVIAAVRPPGRRVSSGVQHFAAGVVVAAVTGEVLPDLRREGHLPSLLIGFVLGVGLLIGLQQLERRGTRGGTTEAALPTGLLVAVGIDLLIDGILVGLGVTLGTSQGRVLTIALTLEILFLALSVTAELAERGTSRVRSAAISSILALAVVVGALGAVAVLGDAPAALVTGVLAFGAAALLYLVTEELLTEAHEAATETPALTAMFFLGFLALFTLEGLV